MIAALHSPPFSLPYSLPVSFIIILLRRVTTACRPRSSLPSTSGLRSWLAGILQDTCQPASLGMLWASIKTLPSHTCHCALVFGPGRRYRIRLITSFLLWTRSYHWPQLPVHPESRLFGSEITISRNLVCGKTGLALILDVDITFCLAGFVSHCGRFS
jgi:hypothetical protein